MANMGSFSAAVTDSDERKVTMHHDGLGASLRLTATVENGAGRGQNGLQLLAAVIVCEPWLWRRGTSAIDWRTSCYVAEVPEHAPHRLLVRVVLRQVADPDGCRRSVGRLVQLSSSAVTEQRA